MTRIAAAEAWSQSDAAAEEAGPMLNWTRLHAVDVEGEAIGHGWRDVEGLALNIGLVVRVLGASDPLAKGHADYDPPPDPPPGFITLVPWHRVAWVRWQRDTPNA